MNFDFPLLTKDEAVADGMARYAEFSGLTDSCVEGDLMFIQMKSRRRFSVYRLQIEKGRKVFKRVPRRLWDKRIQAEIAMRVLYLGKQ